MTLVNNCMTTSLYNLTCVQAGTLSNSMNLSYVVNRLGFTPFPRRCMMQHNGALKRRLAETFDNASCPQRKGQP